MITEDKLAAAQLAQIFGSELTTIDEAVTYRSGNTSKAVKIDPKKILLGQALPTSTNSEVINNLQKEAEAAFPLDDSSHQSPSSPQPLTRENLTSASSSQFDRLCNILERLVTAIENSDVVIKRQPQSRKSANEVSDQQE